jgi:hypothetical protein
VICIRALIFFSFLRMSSSFTPVWNDARGVQTAFRYAPPPQPPSVNDIALLDRYFPPSPVEATICEYITIHSKDRDTSVYPSPSKYKIDLAEQTGQHILNVKTISLYSAIIPDVNGASDEPYLLLQVDEIEGPYTSTNTTSQRACALLQMDHSYGTKFINVKLDTCKDLASKVIQKNLKNLSISFRDQTGAIFDFGSDTAGSPVNYDIQNTLVFKIERYNSMRN